MKLKITKTFSPQAEEIQVFDLEDKDITFQLTDGTLMEKGETGLDLKQILETINELGVLEDSVDDANVREQREWDRAGEWS